MTDSGVRRRRSRSARVGRGSPESFTQRSNRPSVSIRSSRMTGASTARSNTAALLPDAHASPRPAGASLSSLSAAQGRRASFRGHGTRQARPCTAMLCPVTTPTRRARCCALTALLSGWVAPADDQAHGRGPAVGSRGLSARTGQSQATAMGGFQSRHAVVLDLLSQADREHVVPELGLVPGPHPRPAPQHSRAALAVETPCAPQTGP